MQAPYQPGRTLLDATDPLRFNQFSTKWQETGQVMTTRLPQRDSWLLATQAAAAGALAMTWILAPDRGWGGPAAICLAAAIALGLWAFVSLGDSFRVAPTPRAGAHFVRTGIYRWLRHPMYLSVVLVALAAALSRPSRPVMLITLFNIAFYLAKARYEESLLLVHYREYQSYRAHTLGVDPGFARASNRQKARHESKFETPKPPDRS